MKGFSPWYHFDGRPETGALWHRKTGNIEYEAHVSDDSLWLKISVRNQTVLALRSGYFPGNGFKLLHTDAGGDSFRMQAECSVGRYHIHISLPDPSVPIIRCTTKLTPKTALRIPFWPRDLMVCRPSLTNEPFKGKLYVQQEGIRTGWLFGGIESTDPCAFLYLQNLTALNDYASYTRKSLGGTVGGAWPELGFGLPPAPDDPLPVDTEITINDAFLMMQENKPEDENDMAALFLQMLGRLYLQLPLPATSYKPWDNVLQGTLRDLQVNPGCWYRSGGQSYLNAYLCDYDTAPEIMVQLAVLLPLMEYEKWTEGPKLKIVETIQQNLHAFYDEKIESIGRWLPSASHKLDRSEEQKHPRTMDSWYLHHPLVNLARMVMQGVEEVKEMLVHSVEYAIKVAHHFNYEWPVFYHVDTLEVLKAETEPGKGGEHDVAGIYAHLMLLMYEISGEERYLEEAAAAGRSLENKGFSLFYQANVTAFGAKALLRLYLIKKEKVFLKTSLTALATIIRNTSLWDCDYGHGKQYPTFFMLFPLKDAPYAAVYEEIEVLSAMHDYLKMAKEAKLPEHITLLLSEFIRFMIHRCAFYFPPMVRKEMLVETPKTGEIETDTWIPIEDLQDGWNQSGTVGQEVYGAGVPFGIVSRHYKVLKKWNCSVFIDYPTEDAVKSLENGVEIAVTGHPAMFCRMRLLPHENASLPACRVAIGGTEIKGKKQDDGSKEFSIPGKCVIALYFD
ncbi:hypothetical protein WJU16_01150 [Chitinophaga pollutisoli]|uniref:Uncharacterized protein n=1 Tax=Chitinophaga pollutisoli TaxID=3133966 RepID=A0ABZ2YQW3_9BACT